MRRTGKTMWAALGVAASGVWLGGCLAMETTPDPAYAACQKDLASDRCPEDLRWSICASILVHGKPEGQVTSTMCDAYFGPGGAADAGGQSAADGGVDDGGSSIVDAAAAECAASADCPAERPACVQGVCGGCTGTVACAERDEGPVCDGATGSCVPCGAGELGACAADGKVCMAGGHACVECNGPAECTSAAASRCEDHTCTKCVEDADCGHLAGKVCDAGLCVECTPAKETTACRDTDATPGDQSRACDPVAKTCTGKVRGSVSWCGGCASDSECIEGHRCLAMDFAEAPHGSYCLALAPQGLCPAASRSKRTAISALGVQAEYCFPAEALTTCEAELTFGSACTRDADCGASELADGLCVGPPGEKVCTYGCTADRDCPGGFTGACTGPLSGRYCNPD